MAPDPADPVRETKSARTRSAIIDAALRLFREKGYEATTMRAVAAEAGVSVGNAYYYFESKEHLVQGFYDREQLDHAAAARVVLDGTTDLTERIVGVAGAWLDLMDPYRAFAGKFLKNAAEPTSPLSPFSPESAPAREAAIGLWREVIDGSDAKIPKRLRPDLPELRLALLHGHRALLGPRPHRGGGGHPCRRRPHRPAPGAGHRPDPPTGDGKDDGRRRRHPPRDQAAPARPPSA